MTSPGEARVAGEHAVDDPPELLPVLQHEERQERHGGGVQEEVERFADLRDEGPRRRERRLRDLHLAHGPARLVGKDVPHALPEPVDEVGELGEDVADPVLVPGQVRVELVDLRRDVDDEQDDRADQDEEEQEDRDHARHPRPLEERHEGPHREREEEREGDRDEERAAVVEQGDRRGEA